MRIFIFLVLSVSLILFGCGGRVIIDDEENKTNVSEELNQTDIVPPIPDDEDDELPKPKEEIKKTLCEDSDEDNIYTKGVVTIDNKQFEDTCTGPKNLREYECDKDEEKSSIIECPEVHECKNGACSKIIQTCKDSDEKRTHISGVVGISDGTGFVKEFKDSCVNLTHVREYYCDGNKEATEIFECQSNVTCGDGACFFLK